MANSHAWYGSFHYLSHHMQKLYLMWKENMVIEHENFPRNLLIYRGQQYQLSVLMQQEKKMKIYEHASS